MSKDSTDIPPKKIQQWPTSITKEMQIKLCKMLLPACCGTLVKKNVQGLALWRKYHMDTGSYLSGSTSHPAP